LIHSKIDAKKEKQLSKRRETMKWNSSPSKRSTLPNSMLSSKKKLLSELAASTRESISNYNNISYIFQIIPFMYTNVTKYNIIKYIFLHYIYSNLSTIFK